MQRKMKTAISYTIITIILTALALVILIPVVWIGICAFRPQTELMQYPPNAITATMIRLKVSGSMEMEEQELSPMLSRLSPGNRPVCNS